MNYIGVIEGFFGPQWPMVARLGYAPFLRKHGGNFYLYAPKEDPLLRKRWRESWDHEYLSMLQKMKEAFSCEGVLFGLGFSPFGLGACLSDGDRSLLKEKLRLFQELGIDILGIFFDDMPVSENLARTQVETLAVIRDEFKGHIIFCPSFYTPDPILDKVFGQRPAGYLEEIGKNVPPEVDIAWTGPKVISPKIPKEHLLETSVFLRRKPFLWENLFANDGPRNCKFLKIRPFSGRTKEAAQETSGIGLNLMNQPELSKILFLSSLNVLRNGFTPEDGLSHALSELCSPDLYSFLQGHREEFMSIGLDGLSFEKKLDLVKELESFPDAAAREISVWLQGQYNVGSECLTD